MDDECFTWDDNKAALNWRLHGVTFEMAREAFKDLFAIEWMDSGPQSEPYERRKYHERNREI